MSPRVYLALILVQVLFGLWPVAGARALGELSPAALIGFRTLLGAPCLVLLAVLQGGLRRPGRRDLFELAGLAFLGVTGNQLLFTEGLRRAGPVSAAFLMVTIPTFTLAVAVLFRIERPELRRLAGVALALVGAAISTGGPAGGEARLGELLLLANSLLYAGYLALAPPMVARLGAASTVAWVFVLGALEALPVTGPAMISTPWSQLEGGTWFALIFALLGPTVGTYALNGYALRRVEGSLVALFVLLQPIVGAVTAHLVLGSVVPLRLIAGGLVIMAGVVVASTSARRTQRKFP